MDYKRFYEEPPNFSDVQEALSNPACPEKVVVDILTEKIDWYTWIRGNPDSPFFYWGPLANAAFSERQLSESSLDAVVAKFISELEISLEESGTSFAAEMLGDNNIDCLFGQQQLTAKHLEDLTNLLIRCDEASSSSDEGDDVLGGPCSDFVFKSIEEHRNASDETRSLVSKFTAERNLDSTS